MHLVIRLAAVIALSLLSPAILAQAQTPAAVEQTGARATVLSFESEAQVNALASQGKTVVFFFASWCPNCRATVAELNARWADVNPELTLVIADYDKESALKGKYGVTYQDTFVLLDAAGEPLKSWNAGGVDGLNANTAS
ncbi:TlpA family protein disulfide reductase [Devosia limi]|uniref:Thioredoxin n=1 Tax=Devosia limi DSM 17137 TaxID=1121477 RepID=A0A1M4YAI5_9HYPH|nr:thioredoxin family protein [Devosia limi]SHF02512.1 Thioredoxin [Devosia limi DSM 17137]